MTALDAVLLALASASWAALAARVSLVAARMLQIEEYDDHRFLRWSSSDARWFAHRAALAGGALALVTLALALIPGEPSTLILGSGWLAAAVAAHLIWRWITARRALVFTARMRRLLAAETLIVAVLAAGTALAAVASPRFGGALIVVLSGGITLVAPLALVGANLLLRPAERAVRGHYLRRARSRLREVDPLVVAVAGSYGKTSTKHILAHLLDGADVLPTRKSFNTLMGVTRAVNEDLASTHRVFIVEMDAYAPGEIAAMCDLVHPRHAILTSVGPQHLERFGTLSRIAGALYECVESLPREGAAVIHVGDAGGAALAERAVAARRLVVRYALQDAVEPGAADVLATDVRTSGEGTDFRWRWPARELDRRLKVPLLGRHQALNVSAALAMVVLLGRPLDVAVGAAASLQPVDHRLQLLRSAPGVTVIDDSYNANPVGVHEALDVLSTFEGGAKILVTPGLVELGSVEEEENRRYGRHAAGVCDQVIVAEARTTQALLTGLHEGGMSADRIRMVRDLQETTALLSRIARAGDVVLFANDLPDTYLRGPGPRPAATSAGLGG